VGFSVAGFMAADFLVGGLLVADLLAVAFFVLTQPSSMPAVVCLGVLREAATCATVPRPSEVAAGPVVADWRGLLLSGQVRTDMFSGTCSVVHVQ
jgi:hypothetical protein